MKITSNGPVNARALVGYAFQEKMFKDAMIVAEKLHAKKKRDYTGIGYFSHPSTVATLLLEQPLSVNVEMMAAAALEDMLAFERIKPQSIETQFGARVLKMVQALTPVKHVNGQRDHKSFGEQLQAGGYDVVTIKLASLLDHVCSIPKKNLSSAFELFNEVDALLPYLHGGNSELLRRLEASLRSARA